MSDIGKGIDKMQEQKRKELSKSSGDLLGALVIIALIPFAISAFASLWMFAWRLFP